MAYEKVVIGDATLFLSDCREVLPLVTADACVTDPPYGISYVHGGGGRGAKSMQMRRSGSLRLHKTEAIHEDNQPFDPAPLLRFAQVLMFGADHYRARLPDGGTLICWDKHTGIGPNDSFADAEFAWTNLKVKRNVFRFLWKGLASVKAGESARVHPTMKPLGLMRYCIGLMPDAGVIFDPYMGSGSTGVAAMELGRKFIGVEIHRPYFDEACRRIEDAQRQAPLLPPEPPRECVQEGLL